MNDQQNGAANGSESSTSALLCEWIPVSKEPPPEFTPENGKSFLAAWFDGDVIDGIEWYTKVDGEYWNQNSANLNEFDGEGQMKLFTHWMLLPEKISGT